MKTQILRLDPHDDLISTRDKLGWKQTGRILLIWPRRGKVLRRRFDLIMLQRHADQLGAQLALVTRDPLVRFNAAGIGVPVFRNPQQAHKARSWRTRARKQKLTLPENRPNIEELRQRSRKKISGWVNSLAPRILIFVIGVSAVLAVAATLLPGAEIFVTPETDTQSIELPVRALPELQSVNLSGLLPIRLVKVIVEGREQIETTGSIRIPESTSTGEIVFSNLTEQSIQIPAGTIVTAIRQSPLRFQTTRSGTVSGGVGKTQVLPIQALSPGAAYNLPGNSLVALEGPLGLSLSVINLKPTQGGTDRAVPAATELDRNRLRQQLLERLAEDARLELLDTDRLNPILTPGDILLTPKPEFVSVIDESYLPDQQLPSTQIELTLRVEFEAQIASFVDIQKIASAVLDANLPVGYAPVSDTIQIEHVFPPTLHDGEPTTGWILLAYRTIQALPDYIEAASISVGLTPEQAAQRLQSSLPITGSPIIRLIPEWWPRLPLLPFRISVTTRPGS